MIIPRAKARELWIHAQRLDVTEPFGEGADATRNAVEHLGYVQIDTINVIERCHHHILFSRIPTYHRNDLHQAQTAERSVFEYWTHALSYLPTRDFRYYVGSMNGHRKNPGRWFGSTEPAEISRILRTIKKDGALTIRDINGDELVEKTHPWASKKPSKKALELAFYGGQVAISERIGMLKRYELTTRHFGWEKLPKAATSKEVLEFRIDRALRAQAFVSLDSIAYLEPSAKKTLLPLIAKRVRSGDLVPLQIEGDSKVQFWIQPETLLTERDPSARTHLLSPFDPLVIQRKRMGQVFGFEHRFEAYLPKEKRTYGYFALPVLHEDRFVALVDLKTDRSQRKLLIQQWTWLGKEKSKALKKNIEAELHRFEKFQLQT